MLLGYNTNGLAHHDPADALDVLQRIGYESVAITLDHQWLNPFAPDLDRRLSEFKSDLQRREMRSVIETGARYLLDPWQKHEPTLVSKDEDARLRRVDFLRRAIDIAAALSSDCVSLWSGVAHDTDHRATIDERLRRGLDQVVDYAERRRVVIGFEPEPGMAVDTMARFGELSENIGSSFFQLTLDVGHLHCLGETPISDQIVAWGDRIVNVHIEDMRRGVHEHLQFGDGEMDFAPIMAAFSQITYTGGIHVELSRHSHDGPRAARYAFEFLKPLRDAPSRATLDGSPPRV